MGPTRPGPAQGLIWARSGSPKSWILWFLLFTYGFYCFLWFLQKHNVNHKKPWKDHKKTIKTLSKTIKTIKSKIFGEPQPAAPASHMGWLALPVGVLQKFWILWFLWFYLRFLWFFYGFFMVFYGLHCVFAKTIKKTIKTLSKTIKTIKFKIFGEPQPAAPASHRGWNQ